MKTQKDKSEDEEMSDTLNQKAKASKSKKSTEQIKLKESKKVSKQSETGSKSKTKEVEMDIDNAASEVEDEKNADASQSEQSKSQLGKRPVDTRHVKNPEQKRQKTEKGEKSMVSEKRKVKHIEWQYGRHCSRDLWVGKKVKVKFPAKNKDDPADYRFGKLISIKENDKGEKTLFQIEWSHDKKKAKEWVDLNDNRIYIFGQILFLKHHHDNDQIEFIKKTYGWKGKDRKSIPIPVIELIDANDKNKRITPYEDINEKIPIQYFNMEKAKKIKQEVLYDYREFKEEHFDYIRDALKNGDKVHAKISNYKKHYSQWIEKHSKVDIAMNESIKDYTAKVVRVYKEERNCGKAIIMRVLNEEGRKEIVYIRYLKNSKSEWINVIGEDEKSNDSRIVFKLDKIKGVITFNSLRNSVIPKTRMVLPYEFTEKDKKIKQLIEKDWSVGIKPYKEGIIEESENPISEPCQICSQNIDKDAHCF